MGTESQLLLDEMIETGAPEITRQTSKPCSGILKKNGALICPNEMPFLCNLSWKPPKTWTCCGAHYSHALMSNYYRITRCALDNTSMDAWRQCRSCCANRGAHNEIYREICRQLSLWEDLDDEEKTQRLWAFSERITDERNAKYFSSIDIRLVQDDFQGPNISGNHTVHIHGTSVRRYAKCERINFADFEIDLVYERLVVYSKHRVDALDCKALPHLMVHGILYMLGAGRKSCLACEERQLEKQWECMHAENQTACKALKTMNRYWLFRDRFESPVSGPIAEVVVPHISSTITTIWDLNHAACDQTIGLDRSKRINVWKWLAIKEEVFASRTRAMTFAVKAGLHMHKGDLFRSGPMMTKVKVQLRKAESSSEHCKAVHNLHIVLDSDIIDKIGEVTEAVSREYDCLNRFKSVPGETALERSSVRLSGWEKLLSLAIYVIALTAAISSWGKVNKWAVLSMSMAATMLLIGLVADNVGSKLFGKTKLEPGSTSTVRFRDIRRAMLECKKSTLIVGRKGSCIAGNRYQGGIRLEKTLKIRDAAAMGILHIQGT